MWERKELPTIRRILATKYTKHNGTRISLFLNYHSNPFSQESSINTKSSEGKYQRGTDYLHSLNLYLHKNSEAHDLDEFS